MSASDTTTTGTYIDINGTSKQRIGNISSIRKFIANVPDVNTGNRYKVTINLPVKLRDAYSNPDAIFFYCQKVNMPGFSFVQSDAIVYGEKKKIASIKSSDSNVCTTSLLFDYKGFNVMLLEDWSRLIMDPSTKRVGYYGDYTGTLIIQLLNNVNKMITECVLEDAYPVSIPDFSLAYANDSLLPLDINWQYHTRILGQVK